MSRELTIGLIASAGIILFVFVGGMQRWLGFLRKASSVKEVVISLKSHEVSRKCGVSRVVYVLTLVEVTEGDGDDYLSFTYRVSAGTHYRVSEGQLITNPFWGQRVNWLNLLDPNVPQMVSGC